MVTGLQSPQEVGYYLGQRATRTTPEGGRLEGISQVLPPHGGTGRAEGSHWSQASLLCPTLTYLTQGARCTGGH